MAFATGSQLRPELSAVDYTPFLQAASQSAQTQAQGIAQLGAGAAKGFESYVKNKEQEKQASGIIKAADVLSSGFEPILDQIDPRISTALQDLRTRISDPNLSTIERASAAKSFMDQAPTLLNAGVKFLDTQMVTKARAADAAAKAADKLNKEKVAAAARNYAIGKPAGEDLTPDQQNEAFVLGMGMREKGQMTERVDKMVNGEMVPYQVTTNLLTGEKKESMIRELKPTVREQVLAESGKKAVEMGADTVKKIRESADSASAQADLADQMVYALEQGATTGPFAEASATVKSAAESIFGGDYGAAVQKLYVQGAKGLSMIQIRALMKGLGSMSDDDRKAAEKAFINAKDPKQAVLYYAELAKLNKERVDEKNKFIDEMRLSGKTFDEIDLELSKMKREERMLSQIARENVFGGAQPTPTPEPSAVKFTPDEIRAELKRREDEKAKQAKK